MSGIDEIYPDFAAALATCGAGYDDRVLADVIAHKTTAVIDELARNAFAPEQALNTLIAVSMTANLVAGRPLRVLDFGGGCGFHYHFAKRMLGLPLRWAVVETHTMADRAASFPDGRLDFHTDIASASAALGGIDLVHVSGALQYVPRPEDVLQQLAALGAPLVLLARFPLWQGRRLVAVQVSQLSDNGLGPMPPGVPNRTVRYPITFLNIHDVVQALAPNYEIALALSSPSGSYVVKHEPVAGVSYVLKSAAAQPRE